MRVCTSVLGTSGNKEAPLILQQYLKYNNTVFVKDHIKEYDGSHDYPFKMSLFKTKLARKQVLSVTVLTLAVWSRVARPAASDIQSGYTGIIIFVAEKACRFSMHGGNHATSYTDRHCTYC